MIDLSDIECCLDSIKEKLYNLKRECWKVMTLASSDDYKENYPDEMSQICETFYSIEKLAKQHDWDENDTVKSYI